MTLDLDFQPIDATNTDQIQQVVEVWNAACGADLAISPRFVTYNLRPREMGEQVAWLALHEAHPVGFVAASFLDDPSVATPYSGWLDALAVTPDMQGKGIGSALLQRAEEWHLQQGARQITVGAGLRPFVAGVPEEVQSLAFFQRHGYGVTPEQRQTQWDVAADLATYEPPRSVREVDALIRPAQRDDYDAMLAFLQREFPHRWRFDFEQYIAAGGRISDYMVLWTARGVDGCCIVTFEDSLHPIERFYPYRLPKPWAQLGSIGVSADRRGQGFGMALVDAGLRRLHNNGINGCVIDWTDLLDFYAKFGFSPYRTYFILDKTV